MKRLPRLALLTLLLPALAVLPPAGRPARGCAPAFRPGASVRIATESALIIWDAESKTEHFIRRGTFATDTPDFGFLVPTPSKPELDEADDSVFATLEDWTKPEEVVRTVTVHRNSKMAAGRAMPMEAAVAVLGQKRVAGLDTAILRATDTEALVKWLKDHGYATRPALDAWLDRYVKDGWIITAFKIARDAGGRPEVSTKALRMTFTTEKPFYPYREPEDMRSPGAHPGRFLRIFFLGDARMAGVLGEKAGAWPATPVWANRLALARRDELLAKLKLEPGKLPEAPWLTVIEDSSSPRPGTDEIYFHPDVHQSALSRPPVERVVYVEEGSSSGGGKSSALGPRVWIAILAAGALVALAAALAWWFRPRHEEPIA
jgi:hypothetical protein